MAMVALVALWGPSSAGAAEAETGVFAMSQSSVTPETATPADGAPSIVSDKNDYPPGGHVVLTSKGWQSGESVTLFIEDDQGKTWQLNDTTSADADGALMYEFDLPNWFVATYKVVASGESGAQATTTFTDGNMSFPIATAATTQPSSYAVSWRRYDTENCTGGVGETGTVTYQHVSGTTYTSSTVPGVNRNQSLQVTSVAAAAGHEFAFWSSTTSGTTGDVSSAACRGSVNGPAIVTFAHAHFAAAQRATTTAVVSSKTPSVYGETVKFTATVTSSAGNPAGGGSVTFNDGSTTLCNAVPLASGANTAECTPSTALRAGTHPITATYSGTTTGTIYTSSTSPNLSQVVTAKPVTGTFKTAGKVYDGTTSATATDRALVGTLGSDDVSLSGGTGSFANRNVGTDKTVTLSGATLAGNDAGNYTLASVATEKASITPLGITGTFKSADKVYDGDTSAAATNRALVGVIGEDKVTLSGGTASFATKDVGESKTVTLDGAEPAGDDKGNYTLSSVAAAQADITPKPITGTFKSANKVYDGDTSAAATDRVLVGVIGEDKVTLSGGTAAFSDRTAGENKTVTLAGAVLAGDDKGNYSLTSVADTHADITPKPITGTFKSADKVYDGNTSAEAGDRDVVGEITGDDVSLTGGTAAFADGHAGADKMVTLTGAELDGEDKGNYSLTSVATETASITPKPITGTFKSADKVYDGDTSAAATNRALVGVIGEDKVTLSGGTASFATKNVGEGRTVTLTGAELNGDHKDNYTLTSVATETANITPKPITATFKSESKIYDGDTSAAATDRALVGVVGEDKVSLTGGTASFATKNVGEGRTVTLNGATLAGDDKDNYTLTEVADAQADITPLKITGTFEAADKVYDGTADATVTERDLVGNITGDDVSLIGGTAAFSDKNVDEDKTVTLTGATLAGDDKDNYTLTSVGDTQADITALEITGTFKAADKVYNGTADATVTERDLVGNITGDDVTLTGGTAAFSDKNVDENKTVTVTGASLTGEDTGNYTLTSVASTTADVAPKPITGSFKSASKVYDGDSSAAATDRALAGVIGEDKVSLSGGTGSFADRNVGEDRTVTLSGAELVGEDKGNYSLTSVATEKASITPKPITGSFKSADKVYDGNTSATSADRALDGVIGEDQVSLSGGTASFATKNVGEDKKVTLNGATLAGEHKDNYALTSVADTHADITPLAITGSFESADKVYDGNTSAAATGRALDGVLGEDEVTLSGGTATFATRDVGQNKTVSLNGAELAGDDAVNYELTSVADAHATVTPKPLTGSFTADDKEYDGLVAATVTGKSLPGVVDEDAVTLQVEHAAFADRNAGQDKDVAGQLSLEGADAENYSVNDTATTQADITRKPITGSFKSANKVYDGDTAAAAADRALDGVIGEDKVSLTGGTATFATENVAQAKPVTLTGSELAGDDQANYSLASVAKAHADVTPKPVTASFDASNKTYDGTPTASVSGTVVGEVAGDDVALTGGAAEFASRHVGTGKQVTATGYALSGDDADNYALAAGPWTASADITPKQIHGAFTAADKVFDGTAAAQITGRTLSGTYSIDDASLSGGTAAFDTASVGQNKTVHGTGFALSGSDRGNYDLASSSLATKASIVYATGTCLGSAGRTILQPVNADGTSVFKQGSTVPVKFRVCDASGRSVGTPGVVTAFERVDTVNGVEDSGVNEPIISTNQDPAFRWSSTDSQWIYNLGTKNLTANRTYKYRITLADGTYIRFQFGLK